MKNRIVRALLPLLAALLSLCLLAGCGRSAREPEELSVTVTEAAPTVFIRADGRSIAIVDPAGKTISDYLKEAGVTLNEGDMLTFDSDQDVTGSVSISVIRMISVSVLVVSPDVPEGVQHAAVCYGGTVADAVRSVGIELTEDMYLNADPDEPVKDNMTIVITVRGSEPEPESGPEDSEEAPEMISAGPSPSAPSGSSGSSGPGSTSGSYSEAGDSGFSAPSERYVVSVEVYEDCDGSGHGVKVITYSDGSQEEVPF